MTSPVINPTSENSSLNSLYFWLLRALIGDVYITRCLFRSDIAMAYKATTVFPAEVCAETYKNIQNPIFDHQNLTSYRLAAQFVSEADINLKSNACLCDRKFLDVNISNIISNMHIDMLSTTMHEKKTSSINH